MLIHTRADISIPAFNQYKSHHRARARQHGDATHTLARFDHRFVKNRLDFRDCILFCGPIVGRGDTDFCVRCCLQPREETVHVRGRILSMFTIEAKAAAFLTFRWISVLATGKLTTDLHPTQISTGCTRCRMSGKQLDAGEILPRSGPTLLSSRRSNHLPHSPPYRSTKNPSS